MAVAETDAEELQWLLLHTCTLLLLLPPPGYVKALT